MLADLIKFLEEQDPEKMVPYGFGVPDSYRGFYADVAFEPVENASFGDMLAHAKSALGSTFDGYKGGEYTMSEFTDCWISPYGITSENMIGDYLMKYWELTAE